MDSFYWLLATLLGMLVIVTVIWTVQVISYRRYLVRRWSDSDDRPRIIEIPEDRRKFP